VAVANAVEQVVLRLEMHAAETLTEAVVDAVETAVGRAREARVEDAHPIRQAVVSELQYEVVVVPHQREREHQPVVGAGDDMQAPKEQMTKLIVEDRLFVVTARDNVVVRPGVLMARPAWHR
jgi:hypothetical protein